VRALQNLRGETEFEPLAAAFKRVANIIKKAREEQYAEAGEVDPALFEAQCESGLWEACRRMEKSVREDLQRRNFGPALRMLATLRPQVDAFFDGVMVMSEDRRLRANRIALLGRVAALFNEIADFSKLSA
jgi:glycyl-tRNA synthetase beta chain